MIYNLKNPFFTEYMFYLKVEFFNKKKQWNFVKNVMVLNMGNNQRFWYVLKHEDQQWLVCVPLGIHLEPINKTLKLLVTIKENCAPPNKKLFRSMVCHKNTLDNIIFMLQ